MQDGAVQGAEFKWLFDTHQAGPLAILIGWRETRPEEECQMSNTPHELHDDFPEFGEKITEMKQTDAHFARLADEYHEINRAVHRAETNVQPVEDLVEVKMRKKRGALKDELYRLLSA